MGYPVTRSNSLQFVTEDGVKYAVSILRDPDFDGNHVAGLFYEASKGVWNAIPPLFDWNLTNEDIIGQYGSVSGMFDKALIPWVNHRLSEVYRIEPPVDMNSKAELAAYDLAKKDYDYDPVLKRVVQVRMPPLSHNDLPK